MKKKIMLAALLALSIAGLCGCTGEGERDPENPDGSGDIQISVDSEGKVVYDLHPEESAPDPKKTGDLMEIHEGVFSQVLSLRQKKSKGKKLEKWEQEFWRSNRELCVLQHKLSKEEKEERDRLNALLNG